MNCLRCKCPMDLESYAHSPYCQECNQMRRREAKERKVNARGCAIAATAVVVLAGVGAVWALVAIFRLATH